jgi:hypothetical protein
VRYINNQTQDKIAEVIEASTMQFSAQCYELYEIPPLGSLVKTGDIYGIVAGAATTGLEPGRKPIARGKEEASEAAVYEASPQLTRLLRSEFTALVVGYKEGEKVHQYLPPHPARIHSFVYLCQSDEVKEFGNSLSFLHILINVAPATTDELITTALRQMARSYEDPYPFLIAAGKELAILLSNQYDRLRVILGRLQ